jgi:predicted  nucleic acid-binding Zn-ribbon protein
MSKHLTENAAKIAILQKDLKDLQYQLETAHERILELAKDKNSTQEELKQQKQLLLELEGRYSKQHFDTTKKIEKQIEDWPDVLDSRPLKKPEKSFKPKQVPGYVVKKGEKWTRIKDDGTVEYMDIQPGEWD